MGKGKPRQNPDKPQNRIGGFCSYFDECLGVETSICKGNPHNCVKTKYHKMASMSDKQKNEMWRGEDSMEHE